MKSKILAIISIATLMASCSKPDNSNNSNAVNFVVNGIADKNVTQYIDTSIVLPLGFEYVSGTQERITVTATVPADCDITPSSFSGTPTFATVCTLHVRTAVAGNLPVTLNTTTASGATKSFSFNLVAASNPYCADAYVGSFDYVDSNLYDTGGVYSVTTGTTNITRSTTNPNVLVTSLGNITINCSDNNVSTAAVSRADATFDAGTGTRTSNKIDVIRAIHVHDGGPTFNLSDRWHFTRR